MAHQALVDGLRRRPENDQAATAQCLSFCLDFMKDAALHFGRAHLPPDGRFYPGNLTKEQILVLKGTSCDNALPESMFGTAFYLIGAHGECSSTSTLASGTMARLNDTAGWLMGKSTKEQARIHRHCEGKRADVHQSIKERSKEAAVRRHADVEAKIAAVAAAAANREARRRELADLPWIPSPAELDQRMASLRTQAEKKALLSRQFAKYKEFCPSLSSLKSCHAPEKAAWVVAGHTLAQQVDNLKLLIQKRLELGSGGDPGPAPAAARDRVVPSDNRPLRLALESSETTTTTTLQAVRSHSKTRGRHRELFHNLQRKRLAEATTLAGQ